MIACNGWLDVLLYASTRSDIVFSEEPPSESTGLETFAFLGKRGRNLGTTTTIEAGLPARAKSSHGSFKSRLSGKRRGSTASEGDRILMYGLGEIGIKGEVRVTVDEVSRSPQGVGTGVKEGRGKSRGTESVRSWEDGKSFQSGKSSDTWK